MSTPADYGDETWRSMAVTAAQEHRDSVEQFDDVMSDLRELITSWERRGCEEAALVELQKLIDRHAEEAK